MMRQIRRAPMRAVDVIGAVLGLIEAVRASRQGKCGNPARERRDQRAAERFNSREHRRAWIQILIMPAVRMGLVWSSF